MTDRRYAKPPRSTDTGGTPAGAGHAAVTGGSEHPDGRGHYVSHAERKHGRDHASLSRRYVVGFVLSALLVAVAFAVVLLTGWSFAAKLVVIAVAALLQIGVQFYFFLHIDLTRQRREDLQLILFTFLLLVIMCGGTVWILGNLATRM